MFRCETVGGLQGTACGPSLSKLWLDSYPVAITGHIATSLYQKVERPNLSVTGCEKVERPVVERSGVNDHQTQSERTAHKTCPQMYKKPICSHLQFFWSL